MISFRAIKLYLYMLIFLVTLATFVPVMLNHFVNWDDYMFVVDNGEIGTLTWRSLLWMMTSFYQGAWHPVTWLSHAADRALWGLNPAYHHLTSAVIHALNALLVFVLFLELMKGREIAEQGRYVAAFTGALLFAVHPLRVESVAWVSERKDVLCSFFFLSCLIFYLKYARADATAGVEMERGASPWLPPPLTPPARGGDKSRSLLRLLHHTREEDLRILPPCGGGKGGGEVSTVAPRKMSAPTLLETVNSLDSGFLRNDRTGGSRHSRMYYALALMFGLLALLSKPMAVSLPAVLLVLDYYPLERLRFVSWREQLLEKVPFFLLSAATIGLNMWATRGGAITFDYVPFGMRLMNAFYGTLFYIKQTLFPDNLLPLYQMDRGLDYFGAVFLVSTITVIALTACFVGSAFRGHRLWAAVWSYYLITLAPAVGLFMAYRHAVADRYTYLPTLGFYLVAGLGVARLWEKAGGWSYCRAARAAAIACVATLALAYAYKTGHQIAVWRNSETLWTYVLENAHYVPDLAFFGVGLEMEKKGEFDRALALYEKGHSLNPKDPRYVAQKANVIARQGDPEKALGIYQDMAKNYPDDPGPLFNQGRMLAVMGRDEEAVAAFENALALTPREGRAKLLHTLTRVAVKDKVKAREYYAKYISEGYARDPNLEKQLGMSSGGQWKGGRGKQE